ncbi:acyltransferase [Lentilactobacillus raoultii]|uniref:Acyltransferase n=1 Tax=Lentilactobacillus raoultii TaxID=1987503 RepID=A0ABW3PPU1_9LACO|nr:acyltransferase [Lentilactobacillus raoultii]
MLKKWGHFSLWLLVGVVVLFGLVGVGWHNAASHHGNHPERHHFTTASAAQLKAKKIHLTHREKHVAKKYRLNKLQTRTASKIHLTAIGDSVMVDVKPDLKQTFPHSAISGSVGRQFYSLPGIVRQLKASGHLAKYLVINLGTNGPPTKADINSVLKTVGKQRHIFWINTRVPRHWQNTTNRLIKQTAKKHHNVHVVDWYSASKGHVGWFASDRVHVDLTGAVYYTHTLAKEISKDLN